MISLPTPACFIFLIATPVAASTLSRIDIERRVHLDAGFQAEINGVGARAQGDASEIVGCQSMFGELTSDQTIRSAIERVETHWRIFADAGRLGGISCLTECKMSLQSNLSNTLRRVIRNGL
jgi:hypothetical protein